MGILKDILCEELFLESNVGVDSINSALKNHNAVYINYDSKTKEPIASGSRKIYPVSYGISTANNPVLRAYQPEGDTASQVPSWKLFRLDGIKDWKTTNDVFTTRDVPGVKLQHDKQMSQELMSAFGGETEKSTIDSSPISKQDIASPEKRANDATSEPSQKGNVEYPNSVDNYQKNTHIPSGIDKTTPVAPDNKPITKSSFVEPTQEPVSTETEPTASQQTMDAQPNEPIYQDNDNDNDNAEAENDNAEEKNGNEEEGNNEDLDNEVNKVNSLMERIMKYYKKK